MCVYKYIYIYIDVYVDDIYLYFLYIQYLCIAIFCIYQSLLYPLVSSKKVHTVIQCNRTSLRILQGIFDENFIFQLEFCMFFISILFSRFYFVAIQL